MKKYIGKQYKTNEGYLVTIVNYNGVRDILVEFENGYRTKTNMSNVKRGFVKNPYNKALFGVGFLGTGKYKCCESNKITNAYKVWSYMLRRCYNPVYKEVHKTYMNCSVCEEWHNFQNFAEWYYLNYYEIEGEKMCLDKDILLKGNKIYSPNTCIFVPQTINKLFTKRDLDRGNCPIGVHERAGEYIAQISIDGKRKHLKKCKTLIEAFEIYKKAKEDYICCVAERYKNKIPLKLYKAMYNYRVEITD